MKGGEQKVMQSKNTKKIKSFLRLLLWSLLIHLILLLIVTFSAFKKHVIVLLAPSHSKTKESKLKAALRPCKSEFGTTVLFDNRAQFTPPKAQFTSKTHEQAEQKKQTGPTDLKEEQDEKIKVEKQKLQVKAKTEVLEKKAQIIPKRTEIKESEAKHENVKKIEEKTVTIAKQENLEKTITTTTIKKEEALQASSFASTFAKAMADKKATADKKEKIVTQDKDQEKIKEELEEKLAKQQEYLPSIEKLRTFGKSAQDKCPIQPPKRNIIAMTRGYVETLKGKGGDDFLERKSDKNKRPDFEELKTISYEQKILYQHLSTWKEYYANNPTCKIVFRNKNTKYIVGVEYTITEHGAIKDIHLLQSSGNQEADKAILRTIKLSSPLPPLPKHLGVSSYTKRERISIVPTY